MAKKKSKNGGEKKDDDQQKKNNSDGGGKKDGNITVVLKANLHCEGCAVKVIKSIRSFEGVESVKVSDGDTNKLTVIGKVDPVKLREKVEQKTKKEVHLVSPLPNKDKDKDKDKENEKKDGGGGQKTTDDKAEKKKSKEPPVTTAVLKVNLHCEGCVKKIRKTVTKTKGYLEMTIDRQKDLVTVKGTMDMKALAESLKEKLKKPVEIVPPKKEGGGEKKEKGNGGGEGKSAGDGGGDGVGKAAEGNKMQVDVVQYGYPPPYVYGPDYLVNHVHAPQIFSDENPNACSVM